MGFALGADENYYNADGDIVGKTFGRYAGYPFTPYQVLGILCVAFVGFLFISSLILPQMYEVFDRSPEELILLEVIVMKLKKAKPPWKDSSMNKVLLEVYHLY